MHRYTDVEQDDQSQGGDLERLRRAKGDDESFSDAIDRLLGSEDEHPLFDRVGLLDDEELERVRERAGEFRENVDERFEVIMDDVPLVASDGEAARRAVDIQRDLQSAGEPIGAVDAMIAAIALARDEPVVTRNAEEFARTPVRVRPY